MPTGTSRIGAPVNGVRLVAPAVARVCTKRPSLRAELVLTDNHTGLIAERLDAVLTVNVPKDSSLLSTRLAGDVEIIVASPDLAVRSSEVVSEDIEAKRMVPVLPDWHGRIVRIHLCHPSLQRPPARGVEFIRELRKVFSLSGFKAQYKEAASRHALSPPP